MSEAESQEIRKLSNYEDIFENCFNFNCFNLPNSLLRVYQIL